MTDDQYTLGLPERPVMATNKAGNPISCPENIAATVDYWQWDLSYDEFRDNHLINGVEIIDDPKVRDIRLALNEQFGFYPSRDLTFDVLWGLARRNSFHPVQEYLQGLRWDGVPRVKMWLSKYAEADDCEYTREAGTLVLVAGVRRVMQPGVKYDTMLVLEGPQGNNKSTLCRLLAVNDSWFSDNVDLAAATKERMELTRGKWIVEISELSGMGKADRNSLKGMLSRQHDEARLSYDRARTEQSRQFVIIGTTNDAGYLRDDTGNRRFLPVATGEIDVDALRQDVHQLWAEAVQIEKTYGPLWLPEHLWDTAAEEQERRREVDPWEDVLRERLGDIDEGVMPMELPWKMLEVSKRERKPFDSERMNRVMRKLGWENKPVKEGGKVTKMRVKNGNHQPTKDLPRILEVDRIPMQSQLQQALNRLG